MAVLLPTNLVFFSLEVRSCKTVHVTADDASRLFTSTDHVLTGSVTQRSNIERLFIIGLAPHVSSTKWNDAATQCREIRPDRHTQHGPKPFGTVTNRARAPASNLRALLCDHSFHAAGGFILLVRQLWFNHAILVLVPLIFHFRTFPSASLNERSTGTPSPTYRPFSASPMNEKVYIIAQQSI